MASRGHDRWRQMGVTLTGLLVGLAVGTTVLAATLTTYLMISEGSRSRLLEARLHQELNATLTIMRSDLKRAGFWDHTDGNDDSDANGDGTFDWTDFGVDASGTGTFDANGDGLIDDDDLEPTSNPFQGRYAGVVNNDLCTDTDASTGNCSTARCVEHNAAGGCIGYQQTGSCVTYSYDLDADGRVGIRACAADRPASDCPIPVGSAGGSPYRGHRGEPYAWRAWYPPDRSTKTKGIEMEMFGFRLHESAIQLRVGRSGSSDLSFGCDAGRWERITSPDISVGELELKLLTRDRNLSPGKQPTDTCESGDLCRQARSVEIAITAALTDDPHVRLRLETSVAVRNDRYFYTP